MPAKRHNFDTRLSTNQLNPEKNIQNMQEASQDSLFTPESFREAAWDWTQRYGHHFVPYGRWESHFSATVPSERLKAAAKFKSSTISSTTYLLWSRFLYRIQWIQWKKSTSKMDFVVGVMLLSVSIPVNFIITRLNKFHYRNIRNNM